MKEFIKAFTLFLLLAGFAPLLGLWMRGKPKLQYAIFAMIGFMTLGGLFGPSEWGLTLGSIETYRGHAKGFHFYFVEILALALIVTLRTEPGRKFRWMPPGLWLYLLYCSLSMLSIVSAPRPAYVLMAGLKSFKVAILFVASFNFVQSRKELTFFIRVMAVAAFWELFIVLKLKYLSGIYQVRGTFEHQNPLAMYATMLGLLFLSVGMGPAMPRANMILGAFLTTAAIVQSTLSRGGLAIFAVGTILVILCSLFDKPTKRRVVAVSVLGFIGSLGLVLALGTIVARFNDEGNDASSETRHVMNAAAKAMVAAHPLGIGWNNYALTINAPFPYGDVIDDAEREKGHKVDDDYAKGVVESHYYLLLSETGYQGLISYLLFIAVFLGFNLLSMLRFRNHLLGCTSLGIFMGCLCNYVQSSLERVLTQPRNLMLWMLILGIASRIEVWRREIPKNADPP